MVRCSFAILRGAHRMRCKLANMCERPDNRQWSPFRLSDCQKNNRLDRLCLRDGVGCLSGLLASGSSAFGSGCKEYFKHVFRLVSTDEEECPRNSFREHQNSFRIRESTFKFFEFQFPFHRHLFTFEAYRVDRLNHARRCCQHGRYRSDESNHD